MEVNTVNLGFCIVVSLFTDAHHEHHADLAAKTHAPHRATTPGTGVDLMSSLMTDKTEPI